MNIEVTWLGQIEYDAAWDKQKALVSAREENPDLSDELLLLEHPPTYTLGRSGKLAHLLLSETQIEDQGFTVRWVDRGGDITYHGPGQLVGYPILNLQRLFQRQRLHQAGLQAVFASSGSGHHPDIGRIWHCGLAL
ncbi:MAG: hypothetical protein M5U34_13790 [Chloroflexi bacterium]|nr:hypothetical protein [Chloroflexota bacterium]